MFSKCTKSRFLTACTSGETYLQCVTPSHNDSLSHVPERSCFHTQHPYGQSYSIQHSINHADLAK